MTRCVVNRCCCCFVLLYLSRFPECSTSTDLSREKLRKLNLCFISVPGCYFQKSLLVVAFLPCWEMPCHTGLGREGSNEYGIVHRRSLTNYQNCVVTPIPDLRSGLESPPYSAGGAGALSASGSRPNFQGLLITFTYV